MVEKILSRNTKGDVPLNDMMVVPVDLAFAQRRHAAPYKVIIGADSHTWRARRVCDRYEIN